MTIPENAHYGWHFTAPRLRYGDGRKVVQGEVLTVQGTPSVCNFGLHQLETAWGAAEFSVPRSRLSRTAVWGDKDWEDGMAPARGHKMAAQNRVHTHFFTNEEMWDVVQNWFIEQFENHVLPNVKIQQPMLQDVYSRIKRFAVTSNPYDFPANSWMFHLDFKVKHLDDSQYFIYGCLHEYTHLYYESHEHNSFWYKLYTLCNEMHRLLVLALELDFTHSPAVTLDEAFLKRLPEGVE